MKTLTVVLTCLSVHAISSVAQTAANSWTGGEVLSTSRNTTSDTLFVRRALGMYVDTEKQFYSGIHLSIAADVDGFIVGRVNSLRGVYATKYLTSGDSVWEAFPIHLGVQDISLAVDVHGYVAMFQTSDAKTQMGKCDAAVLLFDQQRFKFRTSGASPINSDSADVGLTVHWGGDDNIVMGGKTASLSAPDIPIDAWQKVPSGGYDGFVGVVHRSDYLADLDKLTTVWGTYFGGADMDEVRGVGFDPQGNVVIAGTTLSTDRISSFGSFKPAKSGGKDAFVAKISADGKHLIWGTYFGGGGEDEGTGLTVDKQGNIYICGMTMSSSGIGTPGLQQQMRGSQDGYLAKFSSDGALMWGTYIGGDSSEWINTMALDSTGNVVVGGWTNSRDGISTPWGYQPVYGGDTLDGFVRKYSADGAVLWGTYVGGDKLDQIGSICIAPNGDLYCAGITSSGAGIAFNSTTTLTTGSPKDVFVVRLADELHKGASTGIVDRESAAIGMSMRTTIDLDGTLQIHVHTSARGGVRLALLDILGRECAVETRGDINAPQSDYYFHVNTTSLTSGTYVITLSQFGHQRIAQAITLSR